MPTNKIYFLIVTSICLLVVVVTVVYTNRKSPSNPIHHSMLISHEKTRLDSREEACSFSGVCYYIYNDTQLTMDGWNRTCANASRFITDTVMLEKLREHRYRTMNLKKAHYFVIPMPFINSNICDPIGHLNRTERALNFLVKHSNFNGGRNHILMAHAWQFSAWENKNPIPKRWWDLIENVTLSRYEYYGMSKWENSYKKYARTPKLPFSSWWEITKHVVVVPYASDINIVEPDLQQWKQRKNIIFYHTRLENSSTMEKTYLRRLPLKSNLSGDIGFDIPKEQWLKGWYNSKFCLIICGDTPTSHAFTRAVSAACIPVIISDYFYVGVPFNVDFSLFSVVIPEQQYMIAPDITKQLVGFSDDFIQSKLEALKEAQPKLLYRHQNSTVIEEFFKQVKQIDS